ncbi:MAG: SPOR domain-containing protein [Pseudomonadales bacterium]
MRTIFFILLMLNVCFAIFHIAVSEDSGVSRAAAMEQQIARSYVDAPELKLISDASVETGEVSEPQYDAEEQCWMLGPFDENDLAANVQTRLRATGVQMVVQNISTPVAPDYWVYAVPQDSRQAAVQLLRDLQKRDIDSFIIAEGELENGISLGFFSEDAQAREELDRHKGQSYDVAIKVVPRDIDEFWGVVRINEFEKLSEQAWDRFLEDNGELSLEQNYCDIVATVGNIE